MKYKVLALLVCLFLVFGSVSSIVYGQKYSWTSLEEYENDTGKAITSFKQAPMLDEKVEKGELPEIEERLPEEPLIVNPLGEIGRYGGTIRSGAFGPNSGGVDADHLRLQHLFQIEPDLNTIGPNIAKDWELSEDYKTLTIYLRKGMKWSDGHPFTADDLLFWYNDIALNEELTPVKLSVWMVGGEMFEMVKVDDYTIRMEFAAPYPAIDVALIKSFWNGPFYAPKHYLKQFHINYNPDANDLAKENDYNSWWEYFLYHFDFEAKIQDINRPVISPWMLVQVDALGNKYFERNPYYWKIDPAGNQLPYIDKQDRVITANKDVRIMKFMDGELHNAGENPLPISDYTLYKTNEEKGNYTVYLFDNTRGSDASVFFNLTHKDLVLREIFNDVRFREAMSLAIDRESFNETFFFGKAKIKQATVPSTTSFYEDWMGEYMIEFNSEKANELLTEMGLKWDNNHNVRLRPDGEPLEVTLECTEEFANYAQLIAEQWTAVGVKTNMKQQERTFFYERGLANARDAGIWTFDGVSELSMRASDGGRLRPTWGEPLDVAPLWQQWFDSNGESGQEPPEDVKKIYELLDKFKVVKPGSEEYLEIGKEVLTISSKNLWIIGTVVSPRVILLNNNLGNVPTEGTFAWDYGFWSPYKGDQWYFKK